MPQVVRPGMHGLGADAHRGGDLAKDLIHAAALQRRASSAE